MRLKDPLSGYRLASGLASLHFAYFFAIVMLPKERHCPRTMAFFDTALLNLQVCHMVIFGLTLIS